jgi:hypothetical protein
MDYIQSIRFPRDKFTKAQASKWMKEHNYKLLKGKKVDITETQLRYRLHEPEQGGRYFTKKLKNGIQLVIYLS